MKTLCVKFVTRCPNCKMEEESTFHGVAEILSDWIHALAKLGLYPGWHCQYCHSTVSAQMSDLSVTEEVNADEQLLRLHTSRLSA